MRCWLLPTFSTAVLCRAHALRVSAVASHLAANMPPGPCHALSTQGDSGDIDCGFSCPHPRSPWFLAPQMTSEPPMPTALELLPLDAGLSHLPGSHRSRSPLPHNPAPNGSALPHWLTCSPPPQGWPGTVQGHRRLTTPARPGRSSPCHTSTAY